eukprot:CAMPEP_0194273696 /NCGR_PEP_ID=MMETSP0169-20130528/6984_1 /TAXON_ID=218684 /ORGANISM="Corethron pennatum, Strain L29A3" /LENGTH=717 /DNA_ID=CAMNT_0039016725 /DNA_START=36 /DNA_END=2189 /DNA_ORIENTATION=-
MSIENGDDGGPCYIDMTTDELPEDFRFVTKDASHTPNRKTKRANAITPSPVQDTKRQRSRLFEGCDQGKGPEKEANLHLDRKQKEAIDLARSGRNVFITGPAGSGKSAVLKEILEHLKQTYRCSGEWAAVSPTGMTAIEVEGQTIHSFSGCGVPVLKKDFERCWQEEKKELWRGLEVLVVEEISMMSGEFLDSLSDVVSRIRKKNKKGEYMEYDPNGLCNEGDIDCGDGGSSKPFGGIQLIFCGDFLQLPPISKRIYDIREMNSVGVRTCEIHCDKGYAFQSVAWKEANLKVIQLGRIFRQDNPDFQAILTEIRKGDVSEKGKLFLQKCNRKLPVNDLNIKPTILYPTNKDVTQENKCELDKLTTPEFSFESTDSVEIDPLCPYEKQATAEEKLRNNSFFDDCIAERHLKLKIGAQVMLIKNELGGSYQGRLVNGSRGIVEAFAKKKKDRLSYDGLDDYDFVKNENDSNEEFFPVVQFQEKIKVIRYETFTSRLPKLGECTRTALPLKLAWAVSIHKSQGMSLDYVRTNLQGVFATGQAYVALSRARSERRLELEGFSPSKVMADRRALAFYNNPEGTFPHWNEAWEQADEAIKQDGSVKIDVEVPPAKPGCLRGLLFVCTGEPVHISREGIESLVKACDGVVRNAVSGKTNYLIIGKTIEDGRDVTAGNKYKKAREIIAKGSQSNLKILNEIKFFDLIRRRSKSGPGGLHNFFKPK